MPEKPDQSTEDLERILSSLESLSTRMVTASSDGDTVYGVHRSPVLPAVPPAALDHGTITRVREKLERAVREQRQDQMFEAIGEIVPLLARAGVPARETAENPPAVVASPTRPATPSSR